MKFLFEHPVLKKLTSCHVNGNKVFTSSWQAGKWLSIDFSANAVGI